MNQQAPLLQPALYLVATPIGNLGDVTLRALDVLKQADVIACEDTRHSRKLLDHYGIPVPAVSYHEHNEAERAQELVERLKAGARVALISDAGMPAVSDPGYRLVHAAIQNGIRVIPVPGATAFMAALVASGLPTVRFTFQGFLPARRGERRTVLEALAGLQDTAIFYEAPHRLLECLEDVAVILGANRPVVVARELTKVHEEFVRGSAGEVLEQFRKRPSVRGEIVLLIGKPLKPVRHASPGIAEQMDELMKSGLDENSALRNLAKHTGMSRDELYRELQRKRK
ncbi:MAG: 16S rRNA (cytidine(1402)-2'-O)-methyltransferase [Acidobacteria bacterium]|nr:16S rRNA (cytidine(1402)-2'-O)-methyltransferase [Acidobacteriota bacterium]